MTTDEFRFSPRANRAAEIGWMAWGDAAFERARAEDRPILLSISAVWCHWCHVMDETSYSDPEVIAAIARAFVPIRVDNDRRPDVNARYNMGGWPTTAFLAPDGALLTGATYLPPPQMRRALEEIARFYAQNKNAIAAAGPQLREKTGASASAPLDELNDAAIEQLVETASAAFDEEYGGFGDAPKFPQPELLEFLLARWRATGDPRLLAMVTRTVLGMSRGGTYDRVEGGFFRYSTTRDWSVPHFEKMAEDHAGLLRVLAKLVLFAPTEEARTTLRSAAGYVRATLRDSQSGLFGGSQDADEAYFALPLEERRRQTPPFVDRTSYTNWTCALAGAWFYVGLALDDEAFVAEALETLDRVDAALLDAEGLAYHFLVPGGSPEVRGLLADQAAYLRALLDGHEIAGEQRLLERARALADRTIAAFEAEDGGFYDRLDTGSLGRLVIRDRPIVDNALLAESLLRLSGLTGDGAYRTAAERALAFYAASYASAGTFGAAYARALQRYLAPETSVRIVGAPQPTGDFREAAQRLPGAGLTVRTVPSGRAGELQLSAEPAPAAYVCRGTVCGAPVAQAADLRAAYDGLSAAAEPA